MIFISFMDLISVSLAVIILFINLFCWWVGVLVIFENFVLSLRIFSIFFVVAGFT